MARDIVVGRATGRAGQRCSRAQQEILHDFGRMRQLHLTVTVPLGSDVGTALAAATDVMTRNEHVRKDPAPVVGIAQLTDTGLRIDVNPWVHVPPVGPAEGELYRSLTEGLRLGLGPGRRSPGQRRAGRALSAD